MNATLYELVKESKQSNRALEAVIKLFEPKLKSSLSLSNYREREDLAQELKCKLIKYILGYNVDSIPGFWDMQLKINNQEEKI